MKRWKKALLILLAAGLLFVVCGWDYRLKTVTYRVESQKLAAAVRVACITDLHCCSWGEGQRELLDAVDAAAPDLVVLVGDILDDTMPLEQGYAVLEHLAANWPCFYVTGNHDAQMARQVESFGITVLDGQTEAVAVNGQTLNLCGISDPLTHGTGTFAPRLTALNEENAQQEGYSLLLAHRPEYIQQYLPGKYDVILSGHAHGGQWRIPGLLNGLLAPGQGVFPKYAGGFYEMGATAFIVSRGLAKESTRVPRLYNPPELVLVDLLPYPKKILFSTPENRIFL